MKRQGQLILPFLLSHVALLASLKKIFSAAEGSAICKRIPTVISFTVDRIRKSSESLQQIRIILFTIIWSHSQPTTPNT